MQKIIIREVIFDPLEFRLNMQKLKKTQNIGILKFDGLFKFSDVFYYIYFKQGEIQLQIDGSQI